MVDAGCLGATVLLPMDWWIIIIYLVISLGVGIILSRKGTKDSEAYFKSSGGLTWWLLGTSMVATTFAADTPLVLAGWVVTSGVSKNWFWWCQVPIVMAGVFFFARLWKRANPMTDMEFVYIRYSGKSASFLRGFKALWLALPYSCLVMGWVNKAMAKIINLTIPDFPRIPFVDGLMLWLFMATPLSQGVAPELRQAWQRDDIRPLEIAQTYNLLTYDNVQLFSEIEAGAYNRQPKLALEKLGLADRISTASLHGIAGVPVALYEKPAAPPDDPASPPGASAGGESEKDLVRPVTLADGTVVSYERLRQMKGEALEAGKRALENARTKGEKQTAPLAEMTSLEFLRNIYNIVSNVNQYKILFFLFLLTISYTFISGLWGVMWTDFFQFWLAMFGCILLAVLAVNACGGMDAMMARMAGIYGLAKAQAMVSLVPTSEAGGLGLMSMGEFWIFLLLVWWSVGMTDGGMSFAQRMISAKDERHAALGYLWYGISHFALRMWPWVIVGFAAAVLYPFVPYANGAMPSGAVAEDGYVKVFLDVLPNGFLGLMIAALFAAYMSTISGTVNLGASYLMNDFYRPFIAPSLIKKYPQVKFDEKHYVRIGMSMTLVMALAGIVVSLYLNTIADAWFLLAAFNSGIGLIYLLRWYWHRINAWTEVSCIAALIFIAAVLKWYEGRFGVSIPFPYNLLIAMPFSVSVALLVMLLTKPTDHKQLVAFCKKVQPGGIGWREIEDEIRKTEPGWKAHTPLNWDNVKNWVLSSIAVYCWLFAIGKIVVGDSLFPTITGENAFLGMLALATLVTYAIHWLRPISPFTFLGLIVVILLGLATARGMLGSTPSEFFLNYLFKNRVIGVLLAGVGTVLGIQVARSFSSRRWSETPPAAQS